MASDLRKLDLGASCQRDQDCTQIDGHEGPCTAIVWCTDDCPEDCTADHKGEE